MKNKRIYKIFVFIILGIIIYFAYQFYQENNFYDFIRGESKLYTAKFKKDNEVKYNDRRSFKIELDEFDDAMFYKTIKVNKNTPYKVSCMIKTENVIGDKVNTGIGAQISICDTDERSIAVSGTNDWQKVELIFNSKNRETVDIGFRLGGYLGEAKGNAWFTDIAIEEGAQDVSKKWKFACFIFENVNVNVKNEQISLQATQEDILDITDTIDRFKNSCRELSQNKMIAECDIYNIKEPITTLSYDNQYGYYVSPEDVENHIRGVINENDYDHIFIIVKLGNEEHEKSIEINDWIGLGSMDYFGIGYSNIRIPNDSKSYTYKYNVRVNQFPEEVLLHEFLHSLERNSGEYGYEVPALHDYEKYGYENEPLTGQKVWYTDYMNKNIKTSSGYIGLPKEIYQLKPAKSSDFKYSYKLNEFKEPENIIEEIKELFSNLGRKIEFVFGKNKESEKKVESNGI